MTLARKVKPLGAAEAKASLKRAFECVDVDPKPGELPMARGKRV